MKKPFISKQIFKKKHKCCHICEEKKYELLDVHRIFHGGKYDNLNCVCICITCHRKHHSGLITIKQWYTSTNGKVLHYIDENGEDQFK